MDSPLDSRQLRAFVSLARTSSMTQTAKELFLTHSAISHSMKALESDVGCRLLTTVGKKIVLTEAGETFFVHARRVVGEMRQAREAIHNLNRWGFRKLRLVAEPMLFERFLADVLAAIRKENPQLLLKIALRNPAQLEGNTAGLIAGIKPEHINDAEFSPLLTDRLQFVVNPSHRWAASPEEAQENCAKEPCILFPPDDPLRRMTDAYFLQAEINLNVVAEVDSISAVIALVRRKFGVAILPLWSIKRELAEGRLATVPLGRRALSATWGILHPQGPRLGNVERQFLSACEAKARQLGRTAQNASPTPK